MWDDSSFSPEMILVGIPSVWMVKGVFTLLSLKAAKTLNHAVLHKESLFPPDALLLQLKFAQLVFLG